MPFPRIYTEILTDHLTHNRQMAFLTGPRQVGKTTTCRALADAYLNWDDVDHRRIILSGPGELARHLGLEQLRSEPSVVTLDELHSYRQWKDFLKGFFDVHGDQVKLLVTGSSRLDTYKSGGDSLMGRYLHYRMHPLSVAELVHHDLPSDVPRAPTVIEDEELQALWSHGGHPEPFLKRDRRFTTRWRRQRRDLLLKEDIRDLTRVQELDTIEVVGRLLEERSGTPLIYSSIARDVQVSVDTVRRWVRTLNALHWGFLVRPWFRNVAKSLRKEPKWFLRDWSGIEDEGARAETFVACQLLKAVEGWTDLGLGEFELRHLRDKNKREVDFVVIRDGSPWFLVEVKKSSTDLSPSLAHFQEQLGAPHAFQAVVDLDHVDASCFERRRPTVVPVRTLLSQLL